MTKPQLVLLGTVALGGFALGAANSAAFAQVAATATESAAPRPMQQMQTAITNKDFAAFETAIRNHPINILEQKITAANFDKFVTMHELLRAGKTDESDKIRQELGLPQMPHGKGWRGRHGHRNGMDSHRSMMDGHPVDQPAAS